jgi:hypothetical protein
MLAMFKTLLFATLLFAPSLFAIQTSQLTKYGEGEMKVLFWHLYKAELFGSKTRYSFDDTKLALKITYYRDIDKEDLIEATADQWQHIGVTHQNIPKWLDELATIWPNIKKNDMLIVTRNEDNSASFFNHQGLLGTVNDPDFGDAFLNIWLSEKTTRPKLRAKLVGDKK